MSAPTQGSPALQVTWPSLVARILLRFKAIAGVAFACAVAAGTVSLLSPRQYRSRVAFIPEAGAESSSGLLAAARQFGLGGGSAGSGWPGELYVEALQSRGLLADLAVRQFNDPSAVGTTRMLMDILEIGGGDSAKRVEDAVDLLRTDVLAVGLSRMSGSVTVDVRTSSPALSQALATAVIEQVEGLNRSARQGRAADELAFVEQRLQEAGDSLRQAEDRLARFLSTNRTIASPELTFERERLERVVTFNSQLVSSLVERREDARVQSFRNTPSITIIESARLSGRGEPRGTLLKMVLAAVGGSLLVCGWILLSAHYSVRRAANPSEFSAVEDALRKALRFTRHARGE